MVLGSTFRSGFLVHFYVWCELRGSRFIFFHTEIQLFQDYLLKRRFSLHRTCVGLYLASFLCSHEAFVLTIAPHCLDYCSYIVNLGISYRKAPDFVLCQNGFDCSRSFAFLCILKSAFFFFCRTISRN